MDATASRFGLAEFWVYVPLKVEAILKMKRGGDAFRLKDRRKPES